MGAKRDGVGTGDSAVFSPSSSNSPLRTAQRKARMAFSASSVQNIPDSFRRLPITVLQPASMTQDGAAFEARALGNRDDARELP